MKNRIAAWFVALAFLMLGSAPHAETINAIGSLGGGIIINGSTPTSGFTDGHLVFSSGGFAADSGIPVVAPAGTTLCNLLGVPAAPTWCTAITAQAPLGIVGSVLNVNTLGANGQFFAGAGNLTNTAGPSNIGIGQLALAGLTTGGTGNVAIGSTACSIVTSGSNNFCLGSNSLLSLTTGNGNVGVGNNSLESVVGGQENVGIGDNAMHLVTGSFNTCVGQQCGLSLAGGGANGFYGTSAGGGITSGSNNLVFFCSGLAAASAATVQVCTGNNILHLDLGRTATGWTFVEPVAHRSGVNPSSSPSLGNPTFANSSAVITFANTFTTGQPVQFSTTGTLPTGFSPGVTYFVITTGLSNAQFEAAATVGGAAIVAGSAGSGTHSVYGVLTNSPRLIDTCGVPATATTSGTDTANAANTDTYVSEIYVPANVSSAGVALFNGTTQNGSVTIYLADTGGNQILHTNSTATAGATSYQRIPWTTTPSTVVGPGTYYLYFQNSATSNSWRTWPVGNCGTALQTSTAYGTFPTISPPTTFTANTGPIASLY